MKTYFRACWGFAFGANAGKFCFEQGVMNDYSHSYMSEEQRSSRQNLASVVQRVNSQHALSTEYKHYFYEKALLLNKCRYWLNK